MKILVTGGAGYIGSHTVIELIKDNHEVVIVDNLSNSSEIALDRVKQIVGQEIPFYKIDCADKDALRQIFKEHTIDSVIHFAGFKAVGESVAQPIRYYRNNIDSTLSLCDVMQEKGVTQLIFSSSATVYGTPRELPLHEDSPKGAVTNPYGQTKAMIEQILLDLAVARKDWRITLLRYFNPIGAHESGMIGEDPNGIPNNILPYISQVAVGKLDKVRVFGDDYDTPDGTGVRDYIHVVDLVRGHVAAINKPASAGEVSIYNLGTGKGTSVLELIHAFEKVCGKEIPYEAVERRQGDVAVCYADPSKANSELGWKAEKSIEEGCKDSWNWQSKNPEGYSE
jgi:UDP-glucose 4-epimerase